LKTGEPFDLSANIRSNVPTTTKVKLYQNQFLIEQRDLPLQPGDNEFRAPNLHADGNFISYEVEVVPAQDTSVENNRAQATASLRGQPRVLLVDGEEPRIRPLAEALRREKMQVETRGTLGLPKTLRICSSSIFSPERYLGADDGRRQWSFTGAGCRTSAAGSDDWRREQLRCRRLFPHACRADAAGAHGARGSDGHPERRLAHRARSLRLDDRAGAGPDEDVACHQGAFSRSMLLQPRLLRRLAVDARSHTVVPLAQHATKTRGAEDSLDHCGRRRGFTSGTSLAEAFAQIRDVPARIKHIILSRIPRMPEKNGRRNG
jgi:hypothetical protein